jgi:CheY-like chemotaxis protein
MWMSAQTRGRVLLIEDDDLVRDAAETALTLAGYEVVVAQDGAAGLAALAPPGPCAERPPDVILLDLVMPVLDGAAFLDRYRRAPGPWAPVVIFTAVRDAARQARSIEADGVLAKPFRVEELLATVRRYTAPAEGARRAGRPCVPARS